MTGPGSETIRGMWGADSATVFAVGDNGTLLRYQGGQFVEENSGTTERLNAVWGTSRTHALAVGNNGTILTWDGTGWAAETGLPSSGNFLDVWGTSAADVYVVGAAGVILHGNGSAWSLMDSKTTDKPIMREMRAP